MLQVLCACVPVFIWSPVNFGAAGRSILGHFGGIGGPIWADFLPDRWPEHVRILFFVGSQSIVFSIRGVYMGRRLG